MTRKYLYNYYLTPKSNVYTYQIEIQHITHERVESFLVFNCKKDLTIILTLYIILVNIHTMLVNINIMLVNIYIMLGERK